MSRLPVFHYGKARLTAGFALKLARGLAQGQIDEDTDSKIRQSRDAVKSIVNSGEVVYGVNTGFGPLCRETISAEDTKILQEHILRSHSSGIGAPIGEEKSKLMLILKLHALSKGYSGVSPELIERIGLQIEKNLVPVVPSQGSVGASGDLAPLAHLFLPLIGLGKLHSGGEIVEAGKVLGDMGIPPLTLGPKEGLALINGTQFMAAHGVSALERFHNCLDCADIIGAMTLESLLGSVKPFKPELHELRPYGGTRHTAYRLRHLLQDSEMVESHKACKKVQDPYSLRCMPQVHGASRQAWLHLKETVEIEINS
ncbi:MAG TPA: histidine ammonia-lyase, partial [Spirochaeta sp.]|nr:histidine ammonia-lyase [Spirochaeta sp.]